MNNTMALTHENANQHILVIGDDRCSMEGLVI